MEITQYLFLLLGINNRIILTYGTCTRTSTDTTYTLPKTYKTSTSYNVQINYTHSTAVDAGPCVKSRTKSSIVIREPSPVDNFFIFTIGY